MQQPSISSQRLRSTWHQPTSWLILALLLAAFLALNISSSGTTGGGDTGSGIGGTGRTLEPGSGLGGTGLKPFLGFEPDAAAGPDQTSTELAILPPGTDRGLALTEQLDLSIPPTRDIQHAPLPSPARVAAVEGFTRDSSAISITEQIQREIDSNVLYFARELANSGAATTLSPSRANPDSSVTEQPASELAAIAGPIRSERSLDDQSFEEDSENRATNAADEALPATESPVADALTWGSLASYLATQEPVHSDDNDQSDQAQRLQRPDRVVRPELPPIQRVRPVQRAAVLPPRIKPLSL